MNADFSLAGQVAPCHGRIVGAGPGVCGVPGRRRRLSSAGSAGRADKCAEASNEIGGETLLAEINVTDPVSIDTALKAAEQAFGPVNILINNAGTVTNDALVDTLPEDWRVRPTPT